MNQIVIADVQTEVLSYKGQNVCTTKQLAEFYGASETQLRQNFGNNKERFVEGVHFFALKSEQVVDFYSLYKRATEQTAYAPSLTLWTQRGAARHAKMLKSDKAWEVFEQLEDSYFVKPQLDITSLTKKVLAQMVLEAEEEKERLALSLDKAEKVLVQTTAELINTRDILGEVSVELGDTVEELEQTEEVLVKTETTLKKVKRRLDKKEMMTIGETSRSFGILQKKLVEILHDEDWIEKVDGIVWSATEYSLGEGYMINIHKHGKVTNKGAKRIKTLLKNSRRV